MDITVVGFPRLGKKREWKKALEGYWAGKLSQDQLLSTASSLQQEHLTMMSSLDEVPIDFAWYDHVLETAFLLGVIPEEVSDAPLSVLDKYFALARGYQASNMDIKAWPMKKWFLTNYHYVVPKITASTTWKPERFFLQQRLSLPGIPSRPARVTLVGPYSFFVLSKNELPEDLAQERIASAYRSLLASAPANLIWQFDEPALVMDMDARQRERFVSLYTSILPTYGERIHLQTYFGDIRDIYEEVMSMPFRSVGLDFVEGEQTLSLIRTHGFPREKKLYAGVISGRNVWRTDTSRTCALLDALVNLVTQDQIVLSTSCSLLHVPYSLEGENLPPEIQTKIAFGQEKIEELRTLATTFSPCPGSTPAREYTITVHALSTTLRPTTQEAIQHLGDQAFSRSLPVEKRLPLQKARLHLPPLPTTTIGSFPQTAELRKLRQAFMENTISRDAYESRIREMIAHCIRIQEDIGLDVLVHGEYERNDMVEYFAAFLSGFVTTKNGWVQSYGSRATKPPLIYGDIKRTHPMTIPWISYAQSLTPKPVKAILTGPITIINWSFCREDVSLREVAYQIALALREEIDELQNHGISLIQVDEAALREKLPLRKHHWQTYLETATSAFRLATSGIKPEIQLHTHMCYSEFGEIADAIEALDADVLTIEASRSELDILESLRAYSTRRDIGPGVYDIHSPRIPSPEEIIATIRRLLRVIPPEHLWINPDCGLKTRGEPEALESLKNMVQAAHTVRSSLP